VVNIKLTHYKSFQRPTFQPDFPAITRLILTEHNYRHMQRTLTYTPMTSTSTNEGSAM